MYSEEDFFANCIFLHKKHRTANNERYTEKGGLTMILFLLLFFLLQSFVLFCCLAAGNDPASQAVSDEEQIRYIRQWMELHKR